MSKHPDVRFFVIGAARCGTTSLFRHLTSHSEVHIPVTKEPRFFNTNWKMGWDWYVHQLGAPRRGCIAGDFSPNYSNAAGRDPVARRIAEAYPNSRIIYLVRNPIACALSNWRMAAEIAGDRPDFGRALRGEWACQLRDRSLFFAQISRYRAVFSDDQILVVPLECLRRSPGRWLERIEHHIGLSFSGADRFPRANASFRKRNRPLAPNVSNADRIAFSDLVADDAKRILDYAGVSVDLWSIEPSSAAWTPAD